GATLVFCVYLTLSFGRRAGPGDAGEPAVGAAEAAGPSSPPEAAAVVAAGEAVVAVGCTKNPSLPSRDVLRGPDTSAPRQRDRSPSPSTGGRSSGGGSWRLARSCRARGRRSPLERQPSSSPCRCLRRRPAARR